MDSAPPVAENAHTVLDLGDSTINLMSDSAGVFTVEGFGLDVNPQRERFPTPPAYSTSSWNSTSADTNVSFC
jgi:hypothetical protein